MFNLINLMTVSAKTTPFIKFLFLKIIQFEKQHRSQNVQKQWINKFSFESSSSGSTKIINFLQGSKKKTWWQLFYFFKVVLDVMINEQ